MIIRVTAPAGGLQYPAQKEANTKPVVLSFVITEKHAVKFDGPEMNFDGKIRVVFDSKEAAKNVYDAYINACVNSAANYEINANVQSVHTADPNLYNNVENPAVLWK